MPQNSNLFSHNCLRSSLAGNPNTRPSFIIRQPQAQQPCILCVDDLVHYPWLLAELRKSSTRRSTKTEGTQILKILIVVYIIPVLDRFICTPCNCSFQFSYSEIIIPRNFFLAAFYLIIVDFHVNNTIYFAISKYHDP